MKNKGFMIIMLIFSTVIFIKVLVSSTKPDNNNAIVEVHPTNLDDTTDFYVDSTSIMEAKVIVEEALVISDKFDYVYDRFLVFNPDLDSSTVMVFNNVCKHYSLDTTSKLLEWCVGQILLESGAKQYYETGHPKEGMLVKSSAGATGISQIMPATAYGNLIKYVTDTNAKDMAMLGCTSFDFVNDSLCSKSEGLELTKTWLENETNNIILWGFIMRRKLNERPNILKVLVAYNAGTGGMINYVNNGGALHNHKYVKGIQTKLNYAETKL